MSLFEKYSALLEKVDPIKYTGVVRRVQGLLVESHGPRAKVGEICQIVCEENSKTAWAEVVGLKDEITQLMAYDELGGIEVGSQVIAGGTPLEIPVSDKLLGRVLNSRGKPLDNKGDIGSSVWRGVFSEPPNVLERKRITEVISTGVRSIDALLTMGKGQRMGIFSGSGYGKSTLLGMIARNTSADINVIAMIGERGREVREFIENDLGEEGLKRSVIIVATSNEPAIARMRGAYVATTVAEYFRDQGKDVMLMFDSLTRFARAQREIGLAIGEPPANRGFTPSVFSTLPKLLERSGTGSKGTITAFYTILVEGDDMDEPISDTVRGILDGHIILSRKLTQRNHYPAIDVLRSISRLCNQITGPQTKKVAAYIRRMMAMYADSEDLINVGAYVKGSNPQIDEAVSKISAINDFLIQGTHEKNSLSEIFLRIAEIAGMEIPPEELGHEALSVST
ncbi:MAG: FliI/YscN family ATPase [Spirochaetales bacterium]|nr:FliI/YscN family ATPase [Spirochaetales bacterium]